MSFDQITGRTLTPEEEAIASAAFDRARTEIDDNQAATTEASARFAAAVAAHITAGASVTSIAQLERVGLQRAKDELGKDLLRAVAQTAKRKKDADAAHNAAVIRAGRLLSHREIGDAAGVTHSTVRSMLNRPANGDASGDVSVDASVGEHGGEGQDDDSL